MTSLTMRFPPAQRAAGLLLALIVSACLGIIVGGAASGPIVVTLLVIAGLGYAISGRPWGAILAVVPVLLTSRTDLIGPLLPNLVLAAVGLVAVALASFRSRLKLPFSPGAIALWIGTVGVLVLTALSGSTPVQPSLALAAALTLGLILGQIMRTRNELVGALGFATLPFALLAILEVALRRHLWPASLNGHNVALEISGSEGWRAVSSFGHPLVAGGALAIVATFVWCAWKSPHRSWVSALILVGSLATVSRSALLALVGALVASVLLSKGSRPKRVAGIAALVGGTAVLLAFVPALRESYDSRIFQSTEAQTLRARSADTAATFLRDEPLRSAIGQGIGTSNLILERSGGIEGFTTFDNQYIALLYDVGWLPMFAFALWCVALILRTGRAAMAQSVPAVVAALAVAGFTDSLTWASLALLSYTVLGFAIARDPLPGAPQSAARL